MQGETVAWFRLADRQRKSLQECMEETSSIEFLMWNRFYDQEDWHIPTKENCQSALVASEIRSLNLTLCKIFGKSGKLPDLMDFLLKPKRDESPTIIEIEDANFDNGYGQPGIEIGVDELDEKWQKVNEQAKSEWSAWFGAAVYQDAGETNGNPS